MNNDQETLDASGASLLSVKLEVDVDNKFCLSCLGAGGRWYARFTGLCLPEWKKCKVCMTSNEQD